MEEAYRGAQLRVVWARDASGRLHGKEYFNDLGPKDRSKFQVLFERLGDTGKLFNKEKFRKERNKLFSMKIFKHRLLCFFNHKELVITHGFTKKKDRIPPRELDRADRIREEYLRQKGTQ